MKLFIILAFVSTNLFAADCSYELKKEDLKVEWTAFKTPLKIGVKGSFDKLGVKKDAKGKDLASLLSGIPFLIDVQSVNTGNKDRDLKIYNYFFAPVGPTIKGEVLKYEKSVLKVAITMNGVTKIVPLKVTSEDSSFVADGVIDVLDFNLAFSLKGINNACKDLHEGKTWSDVSIKLSGKYTQTCK